MQEKSEWIGYCSLRALDVASITILKCLVSLRILWSICAHSVAPCRVWTRQDATGRTQFSLRFQKRLPVRTGNSGNRLPVLPVLAGFSGHGQHLRHNHVDGRDEHFHVSRGQSGLPAKSGKITGILPVYAGN
jgi:hypothetical protein